jgi:hypothetical protein
MQWEAKVKGNGIDYVLQNINVTNTQKNNLKNLY